jgi:hypothetical protein
MLTSDPPAIDRGARLTRWFVYGVWIAMTLQALAFVVRYSHNGPIIDEWDFIPALTDEEPFWPWLWKLHNEHRFPVPRSVYYPLFKLTGDFRTGCYVSLAGVSLLSLLMISTAQRLRGRPRFTDAFFPLSLLHLGHWENLRMGYQIVFMMNLVFAGILLRIVLLTRRDNRLRQAAEAGLITLLLVGCGAGGLAFGPSVALWLIALAFWFQPKPIGQAWLTAAIVALAAALTFYIWLYFQGHHRPSHHADPLVVWGGYPEAGWQALRSGLQALSMAFGPAAIGLWPVSAFLLVVFGAEAALLLGRVLAKNPAERPRAFGLLLYLGAMALMALGIGWGRCVFVTAAGEPGGMGLSSRYGWIVWPALACVYFMCLLYRDQIMTNWLRRLMFGVAAGALALVMPFRAAKDKSQKAIHWIVNNGEAVIFWVVVAMLPFNVATGFIEGEKFRAFNAAWEASVREGLSADELVDKYYANCYEELQEQATLGIQLLRKHHVQYYVPGRE